MRKVETRYGKMNVLISDQCISKSLIEYGEWSHDEITVLEQFIKPGMKVLDVGANVGTHTLAFSKAVGPNGLVLAFEPQPVVFGLLTVNVLGNNAVNVLAFNAAAGNAAGWIDLPSINYAKPDNYGAQQMGSFLMNSENEVNHIPIPVHRLDDLKAASSANVIKIDVEGMEAAVLAGARDLIMKSRPVLFVENELPGEASETMLQLLFEMEYDAYYQGTFIFNPNNFNHSKKNLFPNIGCINVLALPRENSIQIDSKKMPTVDSKKITNVSEHPRKK
jgi:FkbM family methyltransferase